MAHIIYTYHGKPYLNITNQCPCACTFCIRGMAQGLGNAESLWHQAEPAWDEIVEALEEYDFSGATEAVFCGYGEPLCALDHLNRAAAWLKERYPALQLRLNTNGLGDLINGRDTAPELAGLIDTVSVSLNAPDALRYQELCHPTFGEASYDAMLRFAAQCRLLNFHVIFSLVDVLSPQEVERCRILSEQMGIPLRVRHRA